MPALGPFGVKPLIKNYIDQTRQLVVQLGAGGGVVSVHSTIVADQAFVILCQAEVM